MSFSSKFDSFIEIFGKRRDENGNHLCRRKTMSGFAKKFHFKPVPGPSQPMANGLSSQSSGAGAKANLGIAAIPSVQAKAASVDDDDLWNDDIDEDMLVMASQLAEKDGDDKATNGTMEIDADTLNKCIVEEEKIGWGKMPIQSQRFTQTQTVFQGVKICLYA